jgi:dihydrofolate reductase
MTQFWKTIDTVLWGRKTYEVALKGGGVGGYGNVKNYVFSRTIKKSKDKEVVIVSEDAAKFVRKLKKQKGKDICVMGGGELGKSLLEANVVDEIGFNIHPVLLGSGIPLFHAMKRQIDLKLLECRPFKNGCVLVRYRVKRLLRFWNVKQPSFRFAPLRNLPLHKVLHHFLWQDFCTNWAWVFASLM